MEMEMEMETQTKRTETDTVRIRIRPGEKTIVEARDQNGEYKTLHQTDRKIYINTDGWIEGKTTRDETEITISARWKHVLVVEDKDKDKDRYIEIYELSENEDEF